MNMKSKLVEKLEEELPGQEERLKGKATVTFVNGDEPLTGQVSLDKRGFYAQISHAGKISVYPHFYIKKITWL